MRHALAVIAIIASGFAAGCQSQPAAKQSANAGGEQAPPPLVDIATDQTDPDHFPDTEPSIAVNPKDPNDIAVVTFSEPWGPGEKAPVWRSSDGGRTWRKVRMLPPIDKGFGGPADQALTFSQDGRLFLVTLGVDQADALLNKIVRPGATPGDVLLGQGFGDDQPQLGLDRSTGACAVHIYSAWLDTVNGAKSMVAASKDEGASVQSSTAADTPPNRTTRLAVGGREAYVVFKSRRGKTWNGLGANGVSVTGVTEATTFFTNEFGNPSKGKVARARSSDAWIAVGADGAVYVVHVNKDTSGFGQLFVARSFDRGQTWQSSRLTDGKHHSAYPEIAVTANGTVGVLYVDYDDAGAKTIFRHRFARSFDQARTWRDEILQVLDPEPIANADDGFLWGDYEGLTAEGNTFFGVFTGVSIGRATPELDPIFFTRSAVQ
jgi:hypothetical protein